MDTLEPKHGRFSMERFIQTVVLVGFAAVLVLEVWLLIRVLIP